MKNKVAYLLIISLLLACVGNAKAEIRSTVKDMSGVKRKLTIDSVENVATMLEYYNYPSEYAQVVDGHYYYMRQTKSYWYTVYRDKGKKVGSFKDTSQGLGYVWYAFGWHEGKLYVEFTNEDDRMIKIGVVDFKQKRIKTICTCTVHPTITDEFWDYGTEVYLYQNKIYAIHYATDGLGHDKGFKVEEFDMSSSNLLNTFSVPKVGKNEEMNFIDIADGKIYYAIESLKGKKQIVTFRCRDMETNKDKKVFRCKVSSAFSSHYHSLIMRGKEIYYYGTYVSGGYWQYVQVYSIPSAGGKMQQIGKGMIRDFAYNKKYYFYIDEGFRLHRQNRKTGKDKVISGIKATKVDCSKKGLYVQKYDKWFANDGFEIAYDDYAPALYFMNFKGGNVKKIAKYTPGHMSYYGWW